MAFTLRLPPELEADLKQIAGKHDRSLQKEVVSALRAYIREQKGEMNMNLQENIQAVNEAAAQQSISVTINPEARNHEVKSVVVDAEHPIQTNPHTGDIFVVNPSLDSWGKAAYPLTQETVEFIASEVQNNPGRRSFKLR